MTQARLILLAVAIAWGPTAPAAAQPARDIDQQVVRRIEPRIYDIEIRIDYLTQTPFIGPRGPNRLTWTERERAGLAAGRFWGDLLIPFASSGDYHAADESTVQFQVANARGGVLPIQPVVEPGAYSVNQIVTRLDNTLLMGIKSRLGYRVQCWNIVFDERAAQQIGWPQEWPREARAGLTLQSEFGIDLGREGVRGPSQTLYHNALAELGVQRLHEMPVHLAAKTVIGYVVRTVRIVEPIKADWRAVVERDGEGGVVQRGVELAWMKNPSNGLQFHGAGSTVEIGLGTTADVVAACVSMLRGVGIPARPVIGAVEGEEDQGEENHLICWGEYYLPGVGWIPFDPAAMTDPSIPHADRGLGDPWPGIGGLQHLNRRIPIAYEFIATDSNAPSLVRYPRTHSMRGEPSDATSGGRVFAGFGIRPERFTYYRRPDWRGESCDGYAKPRLGDHPSGERSQDRLINSPIETFWFNPDVDIDIRDRGPGMQEGGK